MVGSTLTDVERYRYITINQVYQQVATAAEQWYVYHSHTCHLAPRQWGTSYIRAKHSITKTQKKYVIIFLLHVHYITLFHKHASLVLAFYN